MGTLVVVLPPVLVHSSLSLAVGGKPAGQTSSKVIPAAASDKRTAFPLPVDA
eukprot:CAMPEP_0197237790 /NCGR_PEP_ID=MMETSP1429-20130617/4533_1 /TAXON_ID=49237 /ORGANISM="Chaetoceros  sp., Strain UNC1202" /LENGTH=51 /DNA_ID=CAMNT_0042696863 /DNA_START=44 /DNA_END=202 /DNA_ORIENTATION=-